MAFLGDLKIIFVIKRQEDTYEVLKDSMLPPDCDILELYHKACENLVRDVEFCDRKYLVRSFCDPGRRAQ